MQYYAGTQGSATALPGESDHHGHGDSQMASNMISAFTAILQNGVQMRSSSNHAHLRCRIRRCDQDLPGTAPAPRAVGPRAAGGQLRIEPGEVFAAGPTGPARRRCSRSSSDCAIATAARCSGWAARSRIGAPSARVGYMHENQAFPAI